MHWALRLILFAFLLLFCPVHLLIFHLHFPVLFWGIFYSIEMSSVSFQKLTNWLSKVRLLAIANDCHALVPSILQRGCQEPCGEDGLPTASSPPLPSPGSLGTLCRYIGSVLDWTSLGDTSQKWKMLFRLWGSPCFPISFSLCFICVKRRRLADLSSITCSLMTLL